MTRHKGRIARHSLLGASTLGLIVWLGSSAVVTRQLVARPRPWRAESLPNWLRAKSVRIPTRDGEELGAWFHPGRPGEPVILFLHGQGGSRASMALSAQRVALEGNGFLALTLRCFGDSTGAYLDFGWSARADVLAAVEFVEHAKPGASVVVVGQSLGAAAAIFAAPELGRRVDGYVLEAPFRDLDKACRDRLSEHLLAPFDALAYAGLRLWAPYFLPVDPELVRPIDHVGKFPTKTPVLFVAGAFDQVAPVEDVRLLTERCSGQAELAVLDARDHHDLWTLDERHWELWENFLARVELASAEPH